MPQRKSEQETCRVWTETAGDFTKVQKHYLNEARGTPSCSFPASLICEFKALNISLCTNEALSVHLSVWDVCDSLFKIPRMVDAFLS